MSEVKSFSLAVVKGASKGAVLRSVRKRISVGSADDNDLVVDDPNVAPRHFLVLIEAGSWRIHTLSADNSITVDRRWTHPESGKRGAIIHMAAAEIMLYPGELDQRIIDLEIRKRETGAVMLPEPRHGSLVTNVHSEPAEFPDDENVAHEPTLAVRREDYELAQYANMETVAAGRAPDDLREAARAKLQGQRSPSSDPSNAPIVAPSVRREAPDPLANQPVRGPLPKSSGQSWDDEKTVGLTKEEAAPLLKAPSKASSRDRPKPRTSDERVPEILATPESQMMPVPGAAKSVMAARPNFDAVPEAKVIELKPPSKGRGVSSDVKKGNAWGDPKPGAPSEQKPTNAWGDPKNALVRSKDKVEEEPEPEPRPKRNAWGDPRKGEAERAPERAPEKAPERNRNAWGDAPSARSSGGSPAAEPARATPSRGGGALARSDGMRLSIESLVKLPRDRALQILFEPDGKFATAARLLSTRIEEMNKTLGYRTYVLTSPEPLTGKTTSICNLAFALAEDTHRRVALIEANFRYPRFAEILGLDERMGLLSVIEGRAQVPEAVVRLADRNLVVIPAGGRHTHPGEVLSSPRFKQLVAELANTVDVALIDAPSVMPFADVNLLLPLVDGALMVVADHVSKAAGLHKARLQVGESRLLGAVYNQLPKDTRRELAKERRLRFKQKS